MSPRANVRRPSGGSFLVGTDIIEVDRVADSIKRFGKHYIARVYTSDEAIYCTTTGADAARHFAGRFAAKEAAIKVLRPGPSDALNWRSIEVVRNVEGWCELLLHGSAQTLAHRAGLRSFAVSLSHEERYATAVVVAQQRVRGMRNARVDGARPPGAAQ
ncbi:MAG: holo-ACP synthase [Myxococcota bacterium]|nr:holo-ACP synthase [Myxococcota bacterium]